MRLLGIVFIPFLILIWWIPTNGVWNDYQELLAHQEVVRLSLITLIVPLGGLLPVSILIFLFVIAIYTGKQARLIIGEQWTNIINKSCLYSVFLGVVSAIMFTLYSMKLLDEYSYEFNYNLTQITPTGIHLIYVKTP